PESYAFDNPMRIAADNDGVVYAANPSGVSSNNGFAAALPGGNVTDIAISNGGQLYAAANGKLYVRSGNSFAEAPGAPPAGTLRVVPSPNKNELYVMTAQKIYKQTGGGAFSELLPAAGGDFTVDYNGNIFILNDYQLLKYGNIAGVLSEIPVEIPIDAPVPACGIGELVSLRLACEQTGFCDYGDLILADSGSNTVRKVSKSDAGVGVADFDDGYAHPYDFDSDEPVSHLKVRTIIKDGFLYKYPSRSVISMRAQTGSDIFVLAESVGADDYFVYVAYMVRGTMAFDGADVSDKLISGYMLASSLGSDKPETGYKFKEARVLHITGARVYKYPYQNSRILTVPVPGAGTLLPQGFGIQIADFGYRSLGAAVGPYTDKAGANWLAVELNGRIGFVNEADVISYNYDPVPAGIKPNAVIRSIDGGTAALYRTPDENDPYDEPPLTNGAQIYVTKRFDQRSEFTQIIYVNSELGAITAYVKTEYVRYNSFSVIRAVCAAILFASLLICFFLVVVRLNHKRLFHKNRENT
ncbi:MAG: hypothetical protein FWE62_04415, partial [Firmicutes bacterium]|nr:hypothetical protein [Bacillota bacterium]